MTRFSHIAIVALLGLIIGCVERYASEPMPNEPPRTLLWLFPDSTVAEGVSRQHLHWWAEDRDGYVIGYLFSFAAGLSSRPRPDTLTYTWTTRSDTVVQFPLTTARENFLVVVRAVDNTFGGLPVGARIRLTPRPYWDKNGNGMLDAADEELPHLAGAVDPVGAERVFPIRNSPPSVRFLTDPTNPLRTIQQPETTFTVASFSWIGSDPDGDHTLASYRIALNGTDTTRWLTVGAHINLITLMVPRSRSDNASGEVEADVYSGNFPTMRLIGRVPGLKLNDRNVFYLQARDVAGDFSPVVQLPNGTNSWFVKKPKSRMLVIADYQKSDFLDVRNFYRATFSAVGEGKFADYDEFDIRHGGEPGRPGVLVPAILNPAFVQTMKLFDVVFWYTDQFPSLTVAQFPLFLYSSTGGKVIYTTEFASAVADPRGSLVDFAPLDSVSSVDLSATRALPSLGETRIPANYMLIPDSSVQSNIYPVLSFNASPANHTFFMRPVYKRADARYIYRLQRDDRNPIRYIGSPNVAVIDDEKRFVFVGLPLHVVNGSAQGGRGVTAFLNKVLVEEFGIR